ncbi:MAG: FHA domain-containing protein [Pirellulales bacterium]
MPTASPTADNQSASCGRAALVMRIAGKPGPTFVLDSTRENVLGRSGEIDIALADRLASRRHASIHCQDRQWVLTDLESRNGTWVDGRAIRSEPLVDGAVVRIGMTELTFQLLSDDPAKNEASARCVIRSGPVGQLQGDAMRRSQSVDSEDGRRGAMLYHASLRLLATRSSQQLICSMLELVIEHTAASSVGWFQISPTAELKAVCIVPPGGQLASAMSAPVIRSTIDRLVLREGQAVWLQPNPAAGVHSELSCIPLLEGERPHAALVAMTPSGRLQESDFDLLVGLATLAAAAWDGHAACERSLDVTEEPVRSTSLQPQKQPPTGDADADLAGLSTIEISPPRDLTDGMH